MAVPHTYSGFLQARFRRSLVTIVATIGLAEAAVMLLLDALYTKGLELTQIQEALADGSLLALFSFPVIWFTSLRPLVNEVLREATRAEGLGRTNADLRQALDAHALVSITDLSGRVIQANDKFCEASGYSRQEWLGASHRLVNSGQHDEFFFEQLQQTVKSGHIWNGEICNRRKDGALYWVHSTVVPLLDIQGSPIQYISIDRDITSQKKTESKLLALYRAVEASSDMILITKANGSIQYANPALSDFTGWPLDALIGKTPDVLQSRAADAKILHQMREALQIGRSWSGRILMRRLGAPNPTQNGPSDDPLEYWANISITPIRDQDGQIAGYVQLQHDATSQVAAEADMLMERAATSTRLAIADILQKNQPLQQRLELSMDLLTKNRLLTVLPNSGIYLKSSNQDVSRWEPFAFTGNDVDVQIDHIPAKHWLGMTEWTPDIVLSQDTCTVQGDPPTEAAPHGHYLVPLAVNGEHLGLLVILTDPKPSRQYQKLNMLQQVGEKMALALLQDRARVSLETARDAALQAALTKSRFLANMSHEIRTPMNGVLGMLDLLRDTSLNHGQWDLVDTAYASAESLLDIINDILDFSKIEANKIELEAIAFDLPAMVEEVCHLLAGRAHAKSLELNCLVPAGFWRCWVGDPTRIRQVLTNLIGNAIKFTETGEIAVSVSLDNESEATRGGIVLEVRDTGIGIAPEVRAALFQPFAQADSSTARRFGGTGLGLSISKELVQRMAGTLNLDSTPGKGSRFWCSLPLQRGPEDTITKPRTTADLPGKRVLIVDGNGTSRMILRHHLESWGIAVTEADDSPAALLHLTANSATDNLPNLAIMDLNMPNRDGTELLESMAGDPHWSTIPILALTSGTAMSGHQSTNAAIYRILLKPVREQQLYDAVISGLSANPTPVERSKLPSQSLPDYGGRRVLVADDNAVNRKVVTAILLKFNVVADVVENGQEGLEAACTTLYDLVLMDCQMPIMDGYEATRALRHAEATNTLRRQPVVALTAHNSPEERQKCLDSGMDDFLPKPITTDSLARLLERWLGEGTGKSTSTVHDAVTPDREEHVPQLDTSIWNPETALNQLGGDDQLLLDMIGLFLETAPEKLTALQTGWELLNYDSVRLAAHALKGLAGHFLANDMMHLAATLERAASQQQQDDCRILVVQVDNAVNALMDALSHYRDSLSHV